MKVKILILKISKNENPVLTEDGADLVGIKSRTVNAISTQYQNAFRVISGDFVTIEDGTVVHTSPTLRMQSSERGST
jgi:isoleucyl-tRNA synthetase